MDSKYLRKESLCYCPACVKEETELYGEPYWHVLHQFQGVLCCPKHKVKLIPALLLWKIQWAFIPVYWLLIKPGPEPGLDQSKEDIVQMAEEIEWLLRHGFDARVKDGYREVVAGIDQNHMLYTPEHQASKEVYLDILRMGNPSSSTGGHYDPMNRPNYLSMVVSFKHLGRSLIEFL